MQIRYTTTLTLTTVLVAGLLGACGASRDVAYTSAAEVKTSAGAAVDSALETSANAAWDQRENLLKLREAIKLYEQLAGQQPTRRDVMARLARAYYLLGYGHLEEESEVLAAYHAGASWGERILGLSPKFRERVAAGEDDYKVLDTTSKEDAPGIYWAYANLGKWAVRKGFTTVLKFKSKLKAFIDRVAELDPEYYFGAADRGLGAFYAKAPSFAGGDLDKAKQHFDRSLEIAPNYFGTKVLMANYYAVKRQDRALFARLLNEVIAGDPNTLPDAIAIQKIEQIKAKALLGQIEDLFE